MVTGWLRPSPHTNPSFTASLQRSTHHLPGMPNPAIAPVIGSTKPTLISRPASTPVVTVVIEAAVVVVWPPVVVVASPAVVVVSSSPQAASRPPIPAPTPKAAPATPAIFRNSRRLTVRPSITLGFSRCFLLSADICGHPLFDANLFRRLLGQTPCTQHASAKHTSLDRRPSRRPSFGSRPSLGLPARPPMPRIVGMTIMPLGQALLLCFSLEQSVPDPKGQFHDLLVRGSRRLALGVKDGIPRLVRPDGAQSAASSVVHSRATAERQYRNSSDSLLFWYRAPRGAGCSVAIILDVGADQSWASPVSGQTDR